MKKIIKRVAMILAAGALMCGIVGMPKEVKASSLQLTAEEQVITKDMLDSNGGIEISYPKGIYQAKEVRLDCVNDITVIESKDNKDKSYISNRMEFYDYVHDSNGDYEKVTISYSNGEVRVKYYFDSSKFQAISLKNGESKSLTINDFRSDSDMIFVTHDGAVNFKEKEITPFADEYSLVGQSEYNIFYVSRSFSRGVFKATDCNPNPPTKITVNYKDGIFRYTNDYGPVPAKVEKQKSTEDSKKKQEEAKAQQVAIANYIASNPALQAQIAQAMAANPYAGEAAAASVVYGALAEISQQAYSDYMASYQDIYSQMMANYEQMLKAMQNGMIMQ